MKVKKKLDGGLKKISIYLLFFIFSSNISYSSQILDYETEEFIKEIIEDITEVNKINKKINFKLNNSNEINAFVDINNVIHINSGLIIHCSDYVALLSVLAHEVGHIDLNHIALRKKTIENTKKYNTLGLLSVIAGSALTQNPQLLQGSILTSATLSNQYIVFSKDQEMEADLYALKTLNLLKTNSKSIQILLETIEQKLLNQGFSKDKQRISTHPYFEDRILLINNFKKNKTHNFNSEYNKRFNFIKAKFIGYNNNNIKTISSLAEPYKTYAESIKYARDGNLKMSLGKLNKLIKQEINNNYLLETKADILFSYGFINEAIRFYKKNLEKNPNNFYTEIRVFENTDTKNLSIEEIDMIFNDNKKLLFKYYNNKNILLKYLDLAKSLNKTEWIEFFKFYLNISEINEEDFYNEMLILKKTKNKDLKKLIIQIEKNIL